MQAAEKAPSRFWYYAVGVLAVIAIAAAAFFTYLNHAYPDYSGRYQADCQAPACTFTLEWITSNEYWLYYQGEQGKMLRFIDPEQHTYLLNTYSMADAGFGAGSIRFEAAELDQHYVQWQGRTYRKQ